MLGVAVERPVGHCLTRARAVAPVASSTPTSNIRLSWIRVAGAHGLAWDTTVLAVGIASTITAYARAKVVTVRAVTTQALVVSFADVTIGETKLTVVRLITEPQWALAMEVIRTRSPTISARAVTHIPARTGLRGVVIAGSRAIASVCKESRVTRAALVDTDRTRGPELARARTIATTILFTVVARILGILL